MMPGTSLQEVFRARAAEHPDRIAICTPKEQATYGDLDRRANWLAHKLKSLGVGPDVIVGLCVDRSIELIVGMLAVLKAGGAYLPIDPSYPDKRIQFLLSDSAVEVVLAVSRTERVLSGTEAKVVNIDDAGPTAVSSAPPESDVSGSHLAYVIYTSGSTGTPKGVLIEHRNVLRLFEQTEPWFHFNASDVWTMFHSASFDFSVWEIWGALLYGGRLIIVPYDLARSPRQFHTLLQEMGVTVLSQTPAAFRQLMAVDLEQEPIRNIELRLVIFGGEALDVKTLVPWIARYGDERPELINMYGITETTVHVTYRRITKSDLQHCDRSPLGVPIPDMQVHLLDEQGEAVPDGMPGEMYIAGAGLARGYLRRTELDMQRFVTNPKMGPAGTRLYFSGDRALRMPNGDLIYLGRSDGQLKVRGFRIEPREIEVLISGHPDVMSATVVTNDYGDGDVRLLAYVVQRPRAERSEEAIQALTAELAGRAASELPLHMRPSAYYVVPEIPMTSHGKVDREALRQMPVSPRVAERGNEDGMTATERTVAHVWEEVLQRRNIGAQDDFFDVGGTSLALMRILARVNQQFGTSLDGSILAEDATVRRLAACIDVQLQDQELQMVEKNNVQRTGSGSTIHF